MPSQFKIRFPVPRDKLAVATVVVDSDSVEEDSTAMTPPMGPEDIDVSPAIAIDTSTAAGGGPVTSGSAPDVSIVPTAISTTGQAAPVYRTQRAGIIMTWSEAVTGFTEGDVGLRVLNSDLQEVSGVNATLDVARSFPPMGATYTAEVVFPAITERDRGIVEVSIPQNSAESVRTMTDGPPATRTIYLEWNFSGSSDDRGPTVQILPPVGSPVVTSGEETIGFLWNQPVGLEFTAADVTFTNSVMFKQDAMNRPIFAPADYGDIRAEENRYFEGTLTLPESASVQTVTVTVAADSVTNGVGLSGPPADPACNRQARFTYRTFSTDMLDGAPSGTDLICSATYSVENHDWLNKGGDPPAGGAFYGVSDLTLVDGYLYGVVQIRKESEEAREGGTLDPELEAGSALFCVQASRRNDTCTSSDVVEAYDSILQGARSLVGARMSGETSDKLYFFTGSHYAYIHGKGAEIDDDKFGHFFSYTHTQSAPTDLGIAWRSQFGRERAGTEQPNYGVHNTTASPIVHDSTGFHLIAGYGSTDALQINPNRRYLFIRSAEQPDSPFTNRIPRDREENYAARYGEIPVIGDIYKAFQEPQIRRVFVGQPPILFDDARSEFINIEPWSDDIPPDDGNNLWAQEVEISRTLTFPSGRRKVIVRRTDSNVIVREFYENRNDPYDTQTERYPLGSFARGIPVIPVGNVGQVNEGNRIVEGNEVRSLVTELEDNISATFVTNWQWLVRANHIEPNIAFLASNEFSAWDVLIQLATITHSILLFQEDQVFFKPRIPAQAQLSANMTATDNTLSYRDATRQFPDMGIMIIEQEAIRYASRGEASISTLTRALEHTSAVQHCSGRTITVVDHIITDDLLSTPIGEVRIATDFPTLYNQIEIRYADDELRHFQEVEDSVTKHGPRNFAINANLLTTHQVEWVEWLAQTFLDTFGELQSVISFEILTTFDIEVGDYVYLKMSRDDIRRIGQVVNLTQNPEAETTSLQVRTITHVTASTA